MWPRARHASASDASWCRCGQFVASAAVEYFLFLNTAPIAEREPQLGRYPPLPLPPPTLPLPPPPPDPPTPTPLPAGRVHRRPTAESVDHTAPTECA